MQIRNTYLMYVDGKHVNSNKFYNMIPNGDTFRVEYGRVGNSPNTMNYPISKWNSTYRSKTKKGYKDITDLKSSVTTNHKKSDNPAFEDFYDVFSKYTGKVVNQNYMFDTCTQAQIDEAQDILNTLLKAPTVDKANDYLMELYKVIPRRMGNVKFHLLTDLNQLDKLINKEQDALDSMDSSNVIHTEDVYGSLGIDFEETRSDEHRMLEQLINPSNTGFRSASIYKTYKVHHRSTSKKFEDWMNKQSNKKTKLLFHGTRNANIFSILKSGLLVRPSNAVTFAGSAYGDGVYHSAHTSKSLGYTGWENDKIFFIQNVHMGNEYTYDGYYRDGKDISRKDMNYDGLKSRGYDSLFVKAGDGLLNSEYIVYKSEQTTTSYLVWFK